MKRRSTHNKYKELGIDVGFLEVLPLRIKILVSDLARLSVEFLQLDKNIINMYWVWATSRYHVFNTPELLYKDIKGGPRTMLGRILSGEDQKTGKSLVKIIRKIDPQGSWGPDKYDAVLWALNNPHIMKSMRHAEKINSSLLILLHKHVNTEGVIFYQTKFVHQLFMDKCGNESKDVLEDAVYWFNESVRFVELLEVEEQYHHTLIGFRNVDEVKRLHNNLTDLAQETYIEYKVEQIRSGKEVYPSPPISGTDQITPITHVDALLEEGDVMEHCVVSYIGDVIDKKSYIYSMVDPERATIAIDPETYELQDFKLKNNEEPSEESWGCVQEWISRNQVLLSGMEEAA